MTRFLWQNVTNTKTASNRTNHSSRSFIALFFASFAHISARTRWKKKLQKHNTIVVCETNRQCNALLGDNGAICLVLSSHTHCTQHVRIEMLLLKWHRIYRSERLVRQFRNFYLLLFTDTQSAHTCTSTQVHIRKNWLTVNCSRLLTHSHWHTLNAHTHSALISYQ